MFQLISKKGVKYLDAGDLVRFLQDHPRLRYKVCYLGSVKTSLTFTFDV